MDNVKDGATAEHVDFGHDWHQSLGILDLDAETLGEILVAASELERNQQLLAALDLAYNDLSGGVFEPTHWITPRSGQTLAERYFNLFPLLLRMGEVQHKYAVRQIPDAVLRDTLRDVRRWIDAYRTRYGRGGFAESCWLHRHFAASLFALGRLQFEHTVFTDPIEVWQHTDGDNVLLVCGAIASNGFFADSEGVRGLPVRQASITVTETEVCGYPVLPSGRISHEPVALARGPWQLILSSGDPVLNIHIPSGSPLSYESCEESFAYAAKFFPHHFPDQPFCGVICRSWLCSSDLATFLPEESNIVRFQRRFHLYPLPGANADQAFERVFPRSGRLMADDEVSSSLQKAIVSYVRDGGVPLLGGGLRTWPYKDWKGSPIADRALFAMPDSRRVSV